MSPTYAKHTSRKNTPQSEPIPGSTQVKNSAGGYSFPVDDWTRLDRFLVLGSEGGSYYASERKLTKQNAESVLRCLKQDGVRVVRRAVEISEDGRAPKNDSALFVLALASTEAFADKTTRALAFDLLPRVARTGTHLFQYVEECKQLRGWGRGLRRAVRGWYASKTPVDQLAYQFAKYQQRNGWAQRDLLRLSHPKPTSAPQSAVFAFGAKKEAKALATGESPYPALIDAFLRLQTAESVDDVVRLLQNNKNLSWEMVPSQFLGDKEVWAALLPNLPMTALIRNLGRMTANGSITAMSEASKLVVAKLGNDEFLSKARIHPIAVLSALRTYESGRGVKGSLTWNPVKEIVNGLDEAFYTTFKFVEPAGKRFHLALDVSGSMSAPVGGVPGLSCREGTAVMAMVTERREPLTEVAGFSTTYIPLTISSRMRLDAVMNKIDGLPFSGTDCSLPMVDALKRKQPIDTFVVYTDNETWAGRSHPVQALQEYRNKMGIPAKLVVVGMVSNPFTIADPADAGMLDVVGFDTVTPSVISDFARN